MGDARSKAQTEQHIIKMMYQYAVSPRNAGEA
jgi:hypothetical protein